MTETIRRSKTGIAALDDVLHGGLIPERLYLVGNPGSGKTTLALQFLLESVRQHERCLMDAFRDQHRADRGRLLSRVAA